MDHRVVRKKIIKCMAMVFWSILIAFIASVGVDRMVGFFAYRSGYFTSLKPNTVAMYNTNEFQTIATISAQGIRNRIVTTPKPEGVYRVLTVGDSFTFGWGVNEEDSWPRKLESLLSVSGKKVEVINAGAPGMDVSMESRACRAYADRFEVDAIILAVFGSDDFYQAGARAQGRTQFDTIALKLWPNIRRIRSPVLVESWADDSNPGGAAVDVARVWSRVAAIYYSSYPELKQLLSPEVLDDFLHGKINPTFVRFAVDDKDYIIKMLNPDARSAAVLAYRNQFKNILSCAGKRPVTVIFLPSNVAVSESAFEYRGQLGFVMDKKMLTFDFDSMVQSAISGYPVSYISLLSNFRRDGCPDCYYPWDRHLTPAGNTRVAEYVARNIILY